MAPCHFLDLDEENEAHESLFAYRNRFRERLSRVKRETDKKENRALFFSYLLNEIKAQDDAIRHIMSISGLLIGAYATVMVNSIGKIPTGLLNNTTWIRLFDTTQEASWFNMQSFYFIILFPLFIWMYGIMISVMILSPTTNKWSLCDSSSNINISYKLDEENFITAFLIETAQRKYRTYKISSIMMVAGLILAIFNAMLSLPTE